MDEPRFRRKFRLNKKVMAWTGGIAAVLLIAGAVFFFYYFQVKHVEVRGSTRYSEEEIKDKVLNGFFAENSVLAPIFCSEDHVSDMFFVEGWSVTQMSKDTIAINVREKKPVGCLPFLDSYIYFDRNGIFVEGSRSREDKVPFFEGLQVKTIVEDEKLSFKGKTEILNAAVTLSAIFQKEQSLPDSVGFDGKGQITLVYGTIKVNLGENRYLEDKMARAVAILPKIRNRKGILHLESVKDNAKIVTFEPQEMTEEEKAALLEETGGEALEGMEGDASAAATEEAEAAAQEQREQEIAEELQYALYGWIGGYTEWGEFTGDGEYDSFGNHIGPYPTAELIESFGGWKGGFTENGMFNGTGEYDHSGIYVGPNPNAPVQEDTADEEDAFSEESPVATGDITGTGEIVGVGDAAGEGETVPETGAETAEIPQTDGF